MANFLPIAFYVFLRMNLVGEYQACHFVHQNMGAVDAMNKMATEIEAFTQELNKNIQVAAGSIGQGECFKKFTDFMKYDPKTDNTYVPGLWDGTPPMAKTNSHYSRTLQRLKSAILKNILDTSKRKQYRKCTDLASRIEELWEAMKYENFIIGFRNVLAVEAHRKLSEIFKNVSWDAKREIRKMIRDEKHIIENETIGGRLKCSIQQAVYTSRLKMREEIVVRCAVISSKIQHYFDCQGCKKCNTEVQNRHLIADNEKEFEDEVSHFQRELIREVHNEMDTLENRMKTDQVIQTLSKEMDQRLTRKVQEVIGETKSSDLTKDEIEEIFRSFWVDVTSNIKSAFQPVDSMEDIQAIVQSTIHRLLGKDRGNKYILKRTYSKSFTGDFIVQKYHMKRAGVLMQYVPRLFLNDQDKQRLQEMSEDILFATSKHYRTTMAAEGRKFSQRDAEVLFKDVLERIKSVHDERFQITDEYRIDLLCHIEILAVQAFIEMHQLYLQESSPDALLKKKERSNHDIFIIKMGQGDAAAKFCENVLKDLILRNVEERLSCTELLTDLKKYCGNMFTDVKSIQASIMTDLYRQKCFEKYNRYIRSYEQTMKDKMQTESIKHFSTNDRLNVLAITQLDGIIQTLQQAVEECTTEESSENVMAQFFTKIDKLKISHEDAAAYLQLDVPDKLAFGDIIKQKMKGSIRDDILSRIAAWDVEQKHYEKGFTDFMFREVVGCAARCPFCYTPCDEHSAGKTQGNHSSTLHRPGGLAGWRYTKSRKLLVEDCRMRVASDLYFRHGKNKELSTPYKKYATVYPKWSITGNSQPDVEIYWKHVFAAFNSDFANYYCVEEAEGIPEEWSQYTADEIILDIHNNYRDKILVKID